MSGISGKSSELVRICQKLLEYVRICQKMLEYVGICRNMLENVGICRNMSESAENVGIGWNWSEVLSENVGVSTFDPKVVS